jgi:hypothetical protein
VGAYDWCPSCGGTKCAEADRCSDCHRAWTRSPEWFWSKVDVRGPEECWPWQKGMTKGYGVVYQDDRAHRVAYRLAVGPIPEGLVLDHLCRNPPCCNPAHLEPVTLAENTLRGMAPSAINRRKTHCPEGHAYRQGRDQRYCPTCSVAKKRERRARARLVGSPA